MLIWCSCFVLSSLCAIAVATPWFAAASVPILYVYFRVQQYFRDTSRELKRLDSVTRSPVYAHFSETLSGLSTIRAYGEAPRFLRDNQGKIDLSSAAWYAMRAGDRWLSVRLELLGVTIVFLAGVFAAQATLAPSAANNSEIVCPIPRLAPVTIATLPSNLPMMPFLNA